MQPIKWWNNMPRLRNRGVMPGQYAVKFAQMDFGCVEACQRLEDRTPRPTPYTPEYLVDDDRRLQLKELRERCQEILLRHNVPASQWSDDSCQGR